MAWERVFRDSCRGLPAVAFSGRALLSRSWEGAGSAGLRPESLLVADRELWAGARAGAVIGL